MSVSVDIDLILQCDRCGAVTDDDSCTVLCHSCAIETSVGRGDVSVWCKAYRGSRRGTWWCDHCKEDWQWSEINLPSFCPRCGRRLRL